MKQTPEQIKLQMQAQIKDLMEQTGMSRLEVLEEMRTRWEQYKEENQEPQQPAK